VPKSRGIVLPGWHNPELSDTHLKSSSTAWGKVWKLLLRLISVVSLSAILPKTWQKAEVFSGYPCKIPKPLVTCSSWPHPDSDI